MKRTDQMFAAFAAFHKANPQVWDAFRKYTRDMAWSKGRASAKAVWERIRWDVEVLADGDQVKLNNNHTAWYARMHEAVYGLSYFKLRKLSSSKRAPYQTEMTPIEEPDTVTDEMAVALRRLAGEVRQ